MQKITTKQRLRQICSNYVQTILLVLGLICLVIGFGCWFSWQAGLILAGIAMILLALLINYEKQRGD
ncbi:hypothetical protein IMAU80100_00216 [Lactiplantibacillus plantarum]|uniref:hypothetical protein n=1 Tax=Lactiplantibacillus plantarum TaxID=1590 RepID=UPI000977554E|nr:hypothetical protein [Lactiplantibacillus plantarum]AQY70090.1 hypothetical protein BWL06_02865 [Lactiplantibacillus plantarum]MCG0555828.1 hypothetical protein [Lactiplantibacillus plantarum]MCG0635271.1 hypothetical protein [Lactiplantibacillus plantarum]MCG0641434.1 hypothetical protein [Lactiplantibacillus plantarum]MCG0644564.1 hypothetical protein [Lactiplantibacillus plantarum]